MDKTAEMLKQMDLWFKEKKLTKICPECKSEDISLHSTFGIIPTSQLKIPPSPDPTQGFTIVVIGCNNCAHMRLFSANTMGIVPNFEGTSPS